MSDVDRDEARAEIEGAIAELTIRASQAAQAVLRPLAGGQSWGSAYVATRRDTYGRAMRDLAIAKALLRELDELDRFAAGKAPVKP